MNMTLTVPEGSTNHGNPGLLCTPPQWYDYITFYFANYLAHAATVIASPGQGWLETVQDVLNGLLLPTSGIMKAMTVILRHPITTKDPLKRAALAGALCMLAKRDQHDVEAQIRTERATHESLQWQQPDDQAGKPTSASFTPKTSRMISSVSPILTNLYSEIAEQTSDPTPPNWWENDASNLIVTEGTKIYGQYQFPEKEYCLVIVPPYVPLNYNDIVPKHGPSEDELAASRNFLKLLISFIQAIWAIITLYRSRGDQIDQYGYAAFGLTVAPYALMSIINIIANFSTPECPNLFLIRTPIMDQAEEDEQDGVYFNQEIRIPTSKLQEYNTASPKLYSQRLHSYFISMRIGMFIGSMSIVVVGALSQFKTRNGTSIERGFTMSWLIVGIVYGVFISMAKLLHPILHRRLELSVFIVSTLIVIGPCAIGGMVIVGKMIHDFGVCTLLS